jgi:CRISPR-associated endonuclease/helicase Cas3
VHPPADFDAQFESLTGHRPFPWQRALFTEFVDGAIPKRCDLPTGLGKTSVIAVWLLALAARARAATVGDFPRRLVYVVNRRTVVDQATREAENLRKALVQKPELDPVRAALSSLAASPSEVPLAISTLRGQFADNGEWRDDPARAAVVVGTVDMVGSRLLFAGYGRGFKSRPLHAGFVGQDALLIHDEAHLEPAFQDLLTSVEEAQRGRDYRRFRVMALTATSRHGADDEADVFRLTDGDREHPEVRQRVNARKGLTLVPVPDAKSTAGGVTRLALDYADSGQAILIFLRRLEDVDAVAKRLCERGADRVQTLTGTMRGWERDKLAEQDEVFARFKPKPPEDARAGTVYLVCTSAGEVGVDISADHLVCDLTPFDSMAQRLGRVNRFGEGDARVDVVYATQIEAVDHGPEGGEPTARGTQLEFDRAWARTLALLQRLPVRQDGRHDASPAALAVLPVADRQAAFTPPPVVLPATDILFDAWALTSIRETLPGRPMVADWLHGVAEWQPPETYIAWREEVERITEKLRDRYNPEDLLEDYPLKPHETLRDVTSRVFEHLKAIAARAPDEPAWVVGPAGEIDAAPIHAIVQSYDPKTSRRTLANCTVLLPPSAGGLGANGMLDGGSAFDETRSDLYDIADRWEDESGARRARVWDDAPHPDPGGRMRLVRTIDTRPPADEESEADVERSATPRLWRWYARPRDGNDDGSRTARREQTLDDHAMAAEQFAVALADHLKPGETEAAAVRFAARHHDAGKARILWQQSIGNRQYPNVVLAKSREPVARSVTGSPSARGTGAVGMRLVELSRYRHEFGTIGDLQGLPEFMALSTDGQDLALHLIAAHHGRARPHFPSQEVFDPERTTEEGEALAREIPCRFARLQRKYGRWGLAWLESLVRAADALASQTLDEVERESDPVAPSHVMGVTS